MGKRIQTAENTKNWSFFINWSTPPCQSRWSNKIKTIGHATRCTLIISWNSKTWVKKPKLIKMQKKTIILYNFEHSSLLTFIRKQIKIHWAWNYIWHAYYFMQFQYKRFLNVSKDLGKMSQTAKSNQRRSSFISLSTSPCGPWPETKMKTLGMQLHVTFSLFDGILI